MPGNANICEWLPILIRRMTRDELNLYWESMENLERTHMERTASLGNNPALDCGIAPNDSLLVAYLPKLDSVLQEAYFGAGEDEWTAHIIDGVLLDVTRPNKPTRWWQARRAAFKLKLQMPHFLYAGTAKDFSMDSKYLKKLVPPLDYEDAKLYMRAYSHGPWICIEDEQLEKVYGATVEN